MHKLLLPALLLLLLPVWTVAQDVFIGITQSALDAIERGEIVVPPEVLAAIESGNIQIVEEPLMRNDHDFDVHERRGVDMAVNMIMVERAIRTTFEEDPSGFFMVTLAMAGRDFLPGFEQEFGITEEQIEWVREAGRTAQPDNFDEIVANVLNPMVDKIARDANYVLTENEEATINSMFKHVFEVSNAVVLESFTDEQIQKLDGMILALTGGLESPFFNERHMAAIEMTDEQRAQFKAIDEALKPERDQMIAALSKEVIRMTESGEISFNGLVAAFSQFRGFSRELRQRRMAVLTAAQIAKVRQLTRLPDFLSMRSVLPQWMPDANSWRPGDPLPGGAAPQQQRGNFPRPQ